MIFAYADPPYWGCGQSRYGYPEWDDIENQIKLLQSLEEYDAWAFSLHEPSLHLLAPHKPEGSRIAAWVKPFAVFRRGVDPAYTWEPVIFKTARVWSRNQPTCRDHLSCNIALKKGLVGAKPDGFWLWIFDLLGAKPGDTFVDIFPGTGRGGEMWEQYQQSKLEPST